MSIAILDGSGTIKNEPILFRSLVDGSITTVTAEDLTGVTKIKDYAFYKSDIQNIVFPNSLISIGNWAISNTRLVEAILPDTVTSLAPNAFRENNYLTKIVIGNGLISIPSQVFYACQSVRELKLGANITTINTNAFALLYSLSNLVIPNSVTSISAESFKSPYALQKLIILSTTPPTLANSNAFQGIGTRTTCYIYVPYASISSYINGTNWSSYSTMYRPLVNTISDLSSIDTTTYTRACVKGTDESYKEYTYNGTQWNEIV